MTRIKLLLLQTRAQRLKIASALQRQPLHACLTCQRRNGSPGGYLCLACAEHCHADHEIVELWTKRNQRCDCGNDRFSSGSKEARPCTLRKNKPPTNPDNIYNHNLQGRFCDCDLPEDNHVLPEHLRERLCTCPKHRAQLADAKLLFLLDPQDSIAAYEARQRPEREQADEQVAQAAMTKMQQFMPNQRLVLAEGIGRLQRAIQDMARRAQSEGRQVTEADVQEIFRNLGRT
ncbi:uncharacterized protein MONBRDRAFT_29576 [Monosiga brevicollis MX1]|uniref:UBR-type domain-containing protein n=1 Tax=Monosiga brevicollis TaxID=81824 RepID=A9VBH8_MONBE|nr:uncharacterized protein MONBRDRAFT_29576 [Monosiga brevicollis MX1]EDQ85064.1 predicted protein [Monosiga brevicollis MX1]|eukprot:XP_001750068.1 hypothetical protein [Monosiga brevicollis MX1]